MNKKIFIVIIILILVVIVGVWVMSKQLKEKGIEDPTLKKIKIREKIIIGTDATYPPMESLDENGHFVGIDIDIAKEIASDLGVQPDFRNISWEEIFNTLRAGEVDLIISSITITGERAQTMDFSDPYFNAGQVVVTTADKTEIIKGLENLAGKKVAVQTETTSEVEAKKYTDPSLVLTFDNYDLAKQALLAGNVDAIIIDYPAGIGMVAREDNLKIIGEPFTQEFYGVAVKKGEQRLLEEINKTIRRLKRTGELKRIEEKWLTM